MICLLVLHLGNPVRRAHEGVHNSRPSQGAAKRQVSTPEAEEYRGVFATLISQWPTPLQQQLISHSWKEHQRIEQMPSALPEVRLRRDRASLLQKLKELLPSIQVEFRDIAILELK